MDLSVGAALGVILPLLGFALGIAVYSVFVFKLYHFVARRDIFRLHLRRYNQASHARLRTLVDRLLYIAEYLFVLPIVIFFWFVIFAVLLILLSSQPAQLVALVSVAIIAAIRLCSYYSEDLSSDLAKMLPLALLGIFLLNIRAFDFGEILTVWPTAVSMASTLLYYLVFLVLLEWVLRIGSSIVASLEKPQV